MTLYAELGGRERQIMDVVFRAAVAEVRDAMADPVQFNPRASPPPRRSRKSSRRGLGGRRAAARLRGRVQPAQTAYTEDFDRRTRIDAARELESKKTDRWDRRQRTPRRYVRARGRVGSGDGMVRVRAVNGDITIRRASSGGR
jgi:hypothetical protein